MKYKYIYFVEIEQKPKTKIYSCRNNKNDVELGQVKYFPIWRQYCYFPTIQSVYSDGCLNDIVDFIQTLKVAKHD